MQWSAQQEAALKDVGRWLANPGDQQVYRLFGYAGTGKTTLAQHLAQDVGHVLFAAFTGKAASVMRHNGCEGANTIHSLIYHPRDKSRARLLTLERDLVKVIDGLKRNGIDDIEENLKVQELRSAIADERQHLSQPAFTLNPESEVRGADLVVVDECSMVDGRMGEDLLSFDTPVLVLGDPAQLPPIGGGGFFTDAKPNSMLTEIHRQARDNPIVALATQAREKQKLKPGAYGDSRVYAQGETFAHWVKSVDQLLVGKNVTRHGYNRRMRQLAGLEEDGPTVGDKIVCLRNNHDLGLLNGSLWRVEECGGHDEPSYLEMAISPLERSSGSNLEVTAWRDGFGGRLGDMDWFAKKEAEEFDYGYALTVHKAQGSQWDSVLLADESYCFRADKWRWLYTGLTRAAQRVIVVQT